MRTREHIRKIEELRRRAARKLAMRRREEEPKFLEFDEIFEGEREEEDETAKADRELARRWRERVLPPLAHPSHFAPFPELVSDGGEPYEIHDSHDHPALGTSGAVDLKERIMMTRLDERGRSTSLHELGHVLWSPRRLPKSRFAHPSLVLATEDARINRGLEVAGLAPDLDELLCEQVLALGRRDLQRGELGGFVVRAVASIGTGLDTALAALAEDHADPRVRALPAVIAGARERLEAARLRRGALVPTSRQAVGVARWIQNELNRLGVEASEMPRGTAIVCCSGDVAGLGRRRSPFARGRRKRGRGRGAGVRPGEMQVSTPPLTVPCTREETGRARRRRPSAEGVEFRYVERYASDQMVFASRRVRRAGGGSVLVDVSGSMSLGPDDVERIIADAPSATLVAIYSGRGDRGELRVVVRDGRRADYAHLEPYGSGNIVDVPALEWLSRQPGPRVWITDFGVTGCGDNGSEEITRECRRICRKARIKRVRNVGEAAKALARTAA